MRLTLNSTSEFLSDRRPRARRSFLCRQPGQSACLPNRQGADMLMHTVSQLDAAVLIGLGSLGFAFFFSVARLARAIAKGRRK